MTRPNEDSNVSKMESISTSRTNTRSPNKEVKEVKLFKEHIPWGTNLKYLGVTLTLGKHITQKIKTAKATRVTLISLVGRSKLSSLNKM